MKRNFGKLVKIHLPDLGEGTKEATIKEWYVEPGSIVNEVSFLSKINNLKFFYSLMIWSKYLQTSLLPKFRQHAQGP